MGDPSAITVMHSAWRNPGVLCGVGGESNALAVVASVLFAK
jgi:hypothetical protein